MLAKQNRLNREDFSKYFKSGKRTNSPIATLITSPCDKFHGAVVVSKKVSKRAVKRNLLRRRLYSQLYSAYKNKTNGVYILILKPPFIKLTKQEQHQAIKDLIEEVGKTTYNTAHV